MNKKCIVCGKAFQGSSNSKYCSDECRSAKIETTDHVGEKHYELKITSAYRQKSILYARCVCSCGNTCVVRYDCLLNGNTKSCGHMLKENQIKPLDLTAKTNKYGVIAIRKLDKRRNNSCVWECKCSCGKKFELEADLFEKVKSCGCAATEQAKKQMGKLRKDIEDYYIEGTSVLAIKEKKMLKNNTSGVRGVCYDKRRRKWLAQIGFQGYNYYLGRYDLKEDAIAAREEAEKEKFGNFLEWYASEYPDRWEKLQKTEKHIKSEEI